MFSGDENHEITLEEAAALTKTYRDLPPAAIGAMLLGTKGQAFDKDVIKDILDQTGVAGIRIYYGAELLPPKFKLVIVGVDANGDDITSGIILDRGMACPPKCGVANELNS